MQQSYRIVGNIQEEAVNTYENHTSSGMVVTMAREINYQ